MVRWEHKAMCGWLAGRHGGTTQCSWIKCCERILAMVASLVTCNNNTINWPGLGIRHMKLTRRKLSAVGQCLPASQTIYKERGTRWHHFTFLINEITASWHLVLLTVTYQMYSSIGHLHKWNMRFALPGNNLYIWSIHKNTEYQNYD